LSYNSIDDCGLQCYRLRTGYPKSIIFKLMVLDTARLDIKESTIAISSVQIQVYLQKCTRTLTSSYIVGYSLYL